MSSPIVHSTATPTAPEERNVAVEDKVALKDQEHDDEIDWISKDDMGKVLDLILGKVAVRNGSCSSSTKKQQEGGRQCLEVDDGQVVGPLVVGLGGAAGSGKSTVASVIAHALNRVQPDLKAIAIPMDGYHLTRAQLQALPNPKEAVARRGAPWTFAPELLYQDIQRLKKSLSTTTAAAGDQESSAATANTCSFPGFDHAAGDPVPDSYTIDTRDNQVVIIEGLYMVLQSQGGEEWKKVSRSCDVTIFLNADLEVSTERLVRRHMRVWSISEAQARERATGNDYLNSEMLLKDKHFADLIINSVEHKT